TNDCLPEWPGSVGLTRKTLDLDGGAAPIDDSPDAIVYIGDSSSDPTTGVSAIYDGYHAQNHRGLPYGFVYLDVCARYHENWTCTLSHEVLELLADPTAVVEVVRPSQDDPALAVCYSLEVCDPTQGDSYL